MDGHDAARMLLGGIRLFNGLVGLVAPGLLAGRLGVDTANSPATLYVFRMFGIRTVLIGWDLLSLKGERRTEALRQAVWIHASDTVAALIAAFSGKLPPNAGLTISAISALNMALAVYARAGEKDRS